MRPLVFALPHALVFWVAFLWSFFPEFGIVQRARVEAKKEGSKDGGSVQLLMAATGLATLLAYPAAWITSATMFPAHRLWVFYAGVAVMVSGAVLRRICWRALGEYFTGDVRAQADQPVIQTGPYRWVRHPSYTGGMLMYIGTGMALTNWISLAVLFAATAISYTYRVRVEEKAMLSEIGAPYAEFMKTHTRFVPFII